MKRIICGIVLAAVLVSALALSAMAVEKPITVSIPVEIRLAGAAPGADERFSVEISAKTSGAPMPDESVQQIDGTGTGIFVINYNATGAYSYIVKQIPGNNADCVYDTAVYTLKVYVTVNESGVLEVTTLLFDSSDEKINTAVFTNEYTSEPLEPAVLNPPVEKRVEAKHGTAPDDSVFTFAMIPSSKDAPMPENSEAERNPSTGTLTMKKKGPGSYEFGWMRFGEDDIGKIYTYTLKEIPGEDSRYDYDAEVYTMTVKVSEKNGKIGLDVTYTDKGGRSVDKAVFKNVFDGPSTTQPDPDSPQTGEAADLNIFVLVASADLLVLGTVAIIGTRRKNHG